MASLDTIPAEMVAEVTNLLQPNDLTKLARTSKRLCTFAQATLWRSVELHRKDAHHQQFGLAIQKSLSRRYLDDELRDEWSYRTPSGSDAEFDRRNAKFGDVIRQLYSTAGTVEVIGESDKDSNHLTKFPPRPIGILAPAARKVRNVRLRGYIPSEFVTALCKASADHLASLDLGILEEPRIWEGGPSEEYTNYDEDFVYTIYTAPQGPIWFSTDTMPPLRSLTHLLLCKPGARETLPDLAEEEDFEYREDREHRIAELNQWASILKFFRNTVEEVILEQRAICLDYVPSLENGPSPGAEYFDFMMYSDTDTGAMGVDFLRYVLKAIDDGGEWPKLSKATLRGIDFNGLAQEMEESLEEYMVRVLPGVVLKKLYGHHMSFNTRTGAVKNQHGADGLKPQLDLPSHSDYDMAGIFF
ncbi:hypothetical protein N0V90_013477 [Kalmusia sp. IMI 367209]|nr:hypothetical protein N0V90_013477 [Kalmusia sp. IMI 367209]